MARRSRLNRPVYRPCGPHGRFCVERPPWEQEEHLLFIRQRAWWLWLLVLHGQETAELKWTWRIGQTFRAAQALGPNGNPVLEGKTSFFPVASCFQLAHTRRQHIVGIWQPA
jgi:hypothetical protein